MRNFDRPNKNVSDLDQSTLPPHFLPVGDVVDRREYGIGVVGEAFGRDYKTMVRNQPHVRIQGCIFSLNTFNFTPHSIKMKVLF